MANVNPIEGIIIAIAIIIMIVILVLISNALMQSTDNPEAKKQIEETTEKGIDTLVLLIVIFGAIGTLSLVGLFAYLKR